MEAARSDASAYPPDDFQDLVRDALLHLHEPTYLQVHPLQAALAGRPADAASRGTALYRALLGAIEAIRPGPGTPPESRAWRYYRILELRYVDGREVAEILEQIALSKNQYHRDHGRVLQAVASLLWDDWRLADRWPLATAGEPKGPASALARLEAARLRDDERRGSFAPAEVVEGVRALLGPLYAQRAIAFEVAVQPPLAPLRGDRVALRHALIALLAHALREPEARSVRLEALQARQRLEVRVACRGATPAGPLAVGVAESRPFAESLSGEIAVREVDGGLEVDLTLPLATGARPTLLVVDNSADFSRLVERYLAVEGWSVLGATDAAAALAQVEREPVSAVLLDIVLPGRDGWELLQTLKASEATSGIPVIVCSVLNEPEIARSLGATAYLQKPIQRRQLVEALAPLRG